MEPGALLTIFRNVLNLKEADQGDQLRVIDLQVGRQVHQRVPANLRSELWKSVLHRRGIGDGYCLLYPQMLAKGVSEEVADGIEKDVGRTFPGLARFTCEEGKHSLQRVLHAYAAFDEEVNYCQGMNFLAALMLLWLPREAEAFAALALLMRDRGLRELYKTDMAMLQARLWQVGRLMPQRLARHLEAHCAIPVLYASSWLLTAFAADFPIFFASRVMDVVLTDRYLEPIMKVVVGILARCEERLLGMADMERMVDFLRGEVPRWPHDRLQELLTEALAAEWTRAQAAVLERTEGVESVQQAVQRVASRTPQAEEEDAEGDAVPRQPTEPRVASFKWASRLGGLSSSDTETSMPSPQAGMHSSLGELGNSYLGAAGQHIGDLLGMSDAPQQSLPTTAEHAGGAEAQRSQDTGHCPVLLGLNGVAAGVSLKQRTPSGAGSWGPYSRPRSEAAAVHTLDSGSSSRAGVATPPVSPPASPFEKAADAPASQPDVAHADSSGRQLSSHARRPVHRRDSSAASRHSSGLAEMESNTSWGSFRDSEQPDDLLARLQPSVPIPEGQEEAASHSGEPQLSANLLSAVEASAEACSDAGCFLPASSALSAPALLRLPGTGTSNHSSSSPAAISPAQSWQAGDDCGPPQDPFAVQLAVHRESSSLVIRPMGSSGVKTSLSTWEQEQLSKFASSSPSS